MTRSANATESDDDDEQDADEEDDKEDTEPRVGVHRETSENTLSEQQAVVCVAVDPEEQRDDCIAFIECNAMRRSRSSVTSHSAFSTHCNAALCSAFFSLRGRFGRRGGRASGTGGPGVHDNGSVGITKPSRTNSDTSVGGSSIGVFILSPGVGQFWAYRQRSTTYKAPQRNRFSEWAQFNPSDNF